MPPPLDTRLSGATIPALGAFGPVGSRTGGSRSPWENEGGDATRRWAVAEWSRPKYDTACNGQRRAGRAPRLRRAAGGSLRDQPADGLRQRAAPGREDHHLSSARRRLPQPGQPGRPGARAGGAGSAGGPARREPFVSRGSGGAVRRAAQVPALEAVPEGDVRHLRGSAAHHRDREQPAGHLPAGRRQPDGALLRLSHAPVLRRRGGESRASRPGANRAFATAHRVRRV